MKVLIISNTVLSNVTNMGKMLKSYFADFDSSEIAQLYIHSQFPTDADACVQYYRFRDIDALKSIISKNYQGRSYTREDIRQETASVQEDVGSAAVLYQVGRQKTPLMQIGRDLIWKFGRWFNPQLKAWLKEVNPDLVFFASGNTTFMYDVAVKISDFLNVPMVISCCDDYYFFDINGTGLLAKYEHRRLVHGAEKAFARSSFAVTLCQTMADRYRERFGKDCKVLYMGSPERHLSLWEDAKAISYMGNISLGRNAQLVNMGRALQKVRTDSDPMYIDVYSAEKDPEMLKDLIPENGVRFCGSIPSDQVLKVMENSMAVIHTESFDENFQNRVRFSFSTKIADSLRNGPCLLAYGPRGIASIDYLVDNKAAYVIDSEENLEAGMRDFLADAQQRREIVENARKTAEMNHNLQIGASHFRQWLEEAAVR